MRHTHLFALLSVAFGGQAFAGGGPNDLGLNGQHRRPFYIFAHNPNKLEWVDDALTAGANALEPDVMKFSNNAVAGFTNINNHAGPSGLFMYHDHLLALTRVPVTVEDWLDHVHTKVKNGANVALIAFDIKTAAAVPIYVYLLRQAVHTHLNFGGVKVNIIYSVGYKTDAGAFDMIVKDLDDNEGIMVDGENDVIGMIALTSSKGTPRIGYGDGSIGASTGFAPSVIKSIEQAAWFRATQVWDQNYYNTGKPGIGLAGIGLSIPYAFPIPALSDTAKDLINNGVDGLITDLDVPAALFSSTAAEIAKLRSVIDADLDHYVATAADNPFYIPVEAYGLRVHTADIVNAATTEPITFKLIGTCGSASITIDTNFELRYSRGATDFVTIPSKNLGLLQSLTLSSSGSNTWKPGVIEVASARWGISVDPSHSVDFQGQNVDSSTSQTRSLGGWGRQCDVTAPTAAPVLTPPANSNGWNKTDVIVNWNWADDPQGSGVAPAHCKSTSTSSGQGSNIVLAAKCGDADGNVGATSAVVKVDKVAPNVQCQLPDHNWHANDVSVPCVATDALSGLNDPADLVFSVTTSVPNNTDTDHASTVSRTIFDKAGNGRTIFPILGLKVDKKPPVITILQPANGQYVHSATLTFNYHATDGFGSGMFDVVPTMDGKTTIAGKGLGNSQSIPLLTSLGLGQHTFTIKATDNVGNVSTSSVTFTIVVTAQSMIDDVNQFFAQGVVNVTTAGVLLPILNSAKASLAAGHCQAASADYQQFIQRVQQRTPSGITPTASSILIADAQYMASQCNPLLQSGTPARSR